LKGKKVGTLKERVGGLFPPSIPQKIKPAEAERKARSSSTSKTRLLMVVLNSDKELERGNWRGTH